MNGSKYNFFSFAVFLYIQEVICNDICVDNVISFKMIYGMACGIYAIYIIIII